MNENITKMVEREASLQVFLNFYNLISYKVY